MKTTHASAFALAVAIGLLTAPEGAHASGFESARFGGEHGNPLTSNPTAVYYNPAGLALSEGVHLFLDASIALHGASYTHAAAKTDVPEPPGAEGANTGDATLFNVNAAPMAGASAKVGDFAIGAGAYVPFSGAVIWDKSNTFASSKYPGVVDGVQRWSIVEGKTQSIYLTIAAAYAIPGTRLAIGASGNLVYSMVDTVRAREPGGTDDVALEGRSYVHATGKNPSFGVGAMYEAVPKRVWLGLSYQSRPNVTGGMELRGRLKNSFGGAKSDDAVSLYQDLPDIVRLGARWRPSEAFELRLFAAWERWSAFQNQCVASEGEACYVRSDGAPAGSSAPLENLPRRWHDTVSVRAGGSGWLTPDLELFTGVGVDPNAVPAETLDAALPDATSFSAAAGARVKLADHLHAAVSYTHFFFLARETTGEASQAAYAPPSRAPDAGGRYAQATGLVNVGIEASF